MPISQSAFARQRADAKSASYSRPSLREAKPALIAPSSIEDALKGACEAEKAVCVSLTREKKTAAPPKLFDLTSLQRADAPPQG